MYGKINSHGSQEFSEEIVVFKATMTYIKKYGMRQLVRKGEPESTSNRYAVGVKKEETLQAICSKLLHVCCYSL